MPKSNTRIELTPENYPSILNLLHLHKQRLWRKGLRSPFLEPAVYDAVANLIYPKTDAADLLIWMRNHSVHVNPIVERELYALFGGGPYNPSKAVDYVPPVNVKEDPRLGKSYTEDPRLNRPYTHVLDKANEAMKPNSTDTDVATQEAETVTTTTPIPTSADPVDFSLLQQTMQAGKDALQAAKEITAEINKRGLAYRRPAPKRSRTTVAELISDNSPHPLEFRLVTTHRRRAKNYYQVHREVDVIVAEKLKHMRVGDTMAADFLTVKAAHAIQAAIPRAVRKYLKWGEWELRQKRQIPFETWVEAIPEDEQVDGMTYRLYLYRRKPGEYEDITASDKPHREKRVYRKRARPIESDKQP